KLGKSAITLPMLWSNRRQLATMPNLMSELKRRNVFRVAAAYALVAWILIEAGSVLMPTFGAAEWLFRAYVLVVITGFFVALIFAWVFEITPEGVKREKHLDHWTAEVRPIGRKLDFFIIAALAIALAVSVTLNVTGLRNQGTGSSIAVLPFTNRSTDPENAVFTDGIHDDLLTRLANVDSLKVISRTSVMDYRDTKKNLRQIGEELGVETVLEGAVQRSGNSVRINVQLIDASTDEHIWAKSYDHALSAKNVFAIQSEISAAIATALKATLTPQEKARLAAVPTENIEAYRLYSAGRDNLHKRELTALLSARQQFEQAIALDPEYAQAYAGLADAVQLLSINHKAIAWNEAFSVASDALQKALALDSELADGYASLGLLKMGFGQRDPGGAAYEESEAALQRAIALNPSHARAYMWLASLRDRQQRYDEAIELNKRSLEFDPIGRIAYTNIAVLYSRLGRYDDALNQWLAALEIHPSWPTLYATISTHLETLGRLDEAVAWAVKASKLSKDPLAGQNRVRVFVEFGDNNKALAVIEAVPASHPLFGVVQAYEQMIRQDYPAALSIIEAAYAQQEKLPDFIDKLASDVALVAGDYAAALTYCLRQDPSFASDDNPRLNDNNYHNAVRFAYLLLKKGETDHAVRLLESALPVAQAHTRLGVAGNGIRDAQILALLGRGDEALAALQEAADEGFRGLLAFDSWTLDIDPYLESIRNRSEFQSILAEIEADVAVMRERVHTAETSGDWSTLLAIARRRSTDT
ncbi:MAG: tetratricopeptide repeat protein, partial [Pseudomonadales bacterium]